MRLNREVATRLEAAEAFSLAGFWAGLPSCVEQGIIPQVTAVAGTMCVRGTSKGMAIFNRAIGLGMEQLANHDTVEAIKEAFAPSRDWYIDLCPYADDVNTVATLLYTAAFRSVQHTNILVATAEDVPHPEAIHGVDVVRVTHHNLGDYIAIQALAFEMPPEDRDILSLAARNLLDHEGRYIYLAMADGIPAGAAELHVCPNGVSHLAGTATLPAFRRRGIQSLLIRSRAAEARRQGSDMISVQTGIGTQSQFNLESNAFGLVYTKTLWQKETHWHP